MLNYSLIKYYWLYIAVTYPLHACACMVYTYNIAMYVVLTPVYNE